MKNKKTLLGKIKISIVGGLVITSLFFLKYNLNMRNVETGDLKSGKNIFTSENYVNCTAFALDYGNEAIYSHVVPIPKSELFLHPKHFKKTNHLDNVLENSLKFLQEKDIKLKEVTAYLHSGNKQDLEYLKNQIINQGISVKRATYEPLTKTNEEKRRKVIYNPYSDKMIIKYIKR